MSSFLRELDAEGSSVEVPDQGIPGKLRVPAGWKVRRGPQSDHVVYFVAEGGFKADIGGEARWLTSGDLLWVGPGLGFDFQLPAGRGLLLYRFRCRIAGGVRNSAASPCYCIFPNAWPCQGWMERIAIEVVHDDPYRVFRMKGLLFCLAAELGRLHEEPVLEGRRLSAAEQQQVLRYSTQHVAGWPSPIDLAVELRLSPDYFTRVFRRTFGIPPRKWLLQQRIELAGLRLRESTLNVSEVAAEFGYDDVFLFSRQFKAITGFPPARYRRLEGSCSD